MTLLDLAALLLVLIYVALGWWTGTVRRVIGLVAVYIGLLVAFNMGAQGGGIVEQWQPGMSVADARFLSWTFFLALMLLVFEGAATAVHTQLQVAVLAFNGSRSTCATRWPTPASPCRWPRRPGTSSCRSSTRRSPATRRPTSRSKAVAKPPPENCVFAGTPINVATA